MQQLLDFGSHFRQIVQYFCQASQVIDVFSNEGCLQASEEIYLAGLSLPPLARGAMHLDRLGIASIRKISCKFVRE